MKHFWSQIVPGHKLKHYVVTNRAAVTNWSESQIVPSQLVCNGHNFELSSINISARYGGYVGVPEKYIVQKCNLHRLIIKSNYTSPYQILSNAKDKRNEKYPLTWKHTEYSSTFQILWFSNGVVQYIPRNMHTVFALLCFVVVIHWLIFPYPSGLLHWHCGNLTIAPVPAKQPWWIWINTSCEFIMNDCVTTTKQSTTKPCACFLGYTVQN